MTERLPPADWFEAAETGRVIAALEMGESGSSRFVGGCVRNTLMGRPVDDIDIATQMEPDTVLEALQAAGIRAIPTGIEHGTVTAIIDHVPFEITSLRRDVETDGRRAVVAYTRDWAEDAMRRDFRLNAIYADPDGQLHDPTGGGIEDAASGHVIFIGDADERLREDYLRILRFFRFNAWYGAKIDDAGLEACARQKEGLKKIAPERSWKELKKLLVAPDPSEALCHMGQAGILEIVLGGDWEGVQGVKGLVAIEAKYDQSADPMQRFMAMMPSDQEYLKRLGQRLRLSNNEASRLVASANPALPVLGNADTQSIKTNLYQFETEAVIDRALIAAARSDAPLSQDFLDICKGWVRPVFPLKGEDLLKAGFQPGPAIGDMLRDMEAWWVAGDFAANRPELLEELERRLKAD